MSKVGVAIMPTRTSVDAFIAHVISGDHVGALRDWYHDDAWTQENQAPPNEGGLEVLLKREGAMMARTQSVRTELLGGPAIEGDQVAIRWRFTFDFKDGGKLQQEEIAWQTWRGEKIATETFFYDPAQRG
jgi:ketosteroid isomerase-like protein